MNKFLADLYGTAQTVGATDSSSDVEKLAEAKILDDFFTAENIDVDKLSDESILKVASALFGNDSAIVKEAGDMPPQFEEGKEHEKKESKKDEDKEKEKGEETDEEKVAQADFIGRVMAHAFWQEKGNLEKAAAAGKAPAKEPESKLASLIKGIKKEASAPKQEKPKEKTASPAIEVLARQQAFEMLKEAGLVDDEGNPVQQAATSDEEKLAAAVNTRTAEILKELGYEMK